MDSRTIEVEEETERGERVPLEEDVDRMREKAFLGQEWTSKYFGTPDAEVSEYRVSLRDGYYYLETLRKMPDAKTAYGYTGVMVHERDLYAMVKVLVQAVRDKQQREEATSNAK